MGKQLIISIHLLFSFYIIGYSQTIDTTENLTKWAKIYQITLDSYFKEDTSLNEGMEFIAIDLTTLKYSNDFDKKVILMWFENNYVPVIDTNFNGLKDKGLFNEEYLYIPNGLFLKINEVNETNNEIIIEGMKYHGGEAAIWFRTIWRLNNSNWEFIKTIMTMIS